MAGEAGGRLTAYCSRPPSRAASSRYLPVYHHRWSALSANSGDGCLGEPSANVRARVEKAREVQRQRFAGAPGGASGKMALLCNTDMGPAEVRECCRLDDAGKSLPLGPAIP